MKEYTVRYYLTDEQDARLRALTERFNRVMGTDNEPGTVLDAMMTVGSAKGIERHLEEMDRTLSGVEAKMEGDCGECQV